MPPPWKCSRPGWMELSATWSSGRCPCPWQEVGTRWSWRFLPTLTILWFYELDPKMGLLQGAAASAPVLLTPGRQLQVRTKRPGQDANSCSAEGVSTSHLLVSSCLLEGYHLPISVGGITLSKCCLIHFRHNQTGCFKQSELVGWAQPADFPWSP